MVDVASTTPTSAAPAPGRTLEHRRAQAHQLRPAELDVPLDAVAAEPVTWDTISARIASGIASNARPAQSSTDATKLIVAARVTAADA